MTDEIVPPTSEAIPPEQPEVPEQKSAPRYERRAFAMEIKIEQRHRSAPPTLIGHAAVFDQVADLGYMRESIAPGAFARTLREGNPVYALWNHNPDYIIASTKNGSLRLSEDKTGLVAEMDPMDTPTIRDLVIKPMQDGMVDKMSFGFETVRDEVSSDKMGPVRVLRDVNLFDVSPVTFPAYEGTDIQSRLSTIMSRVERDLPLTENDQTLMQTLRGLLARRRPRVLRQGKADPQTLALIAQIDMCIDQADDMVDKLMDEFGIPDEDDAEPMADMPTQMTTHSARAQIAQESDASATNGAGALEAEVRARTLRMLEIQMKGQLHA